MSDRYGQGGSRAWRHVRQLVLERARYRCEIEVPGVCVHGATQVDHKENLAALGISRNDPRALDPANLQATCDRCHRYKTERERVKALAESNRQRAEARRARLGRKPRPHPGDD